LDRIGGSTRVRNSLAEALTDGTRGVTAKVRWLSVAAPGPDEDRVEEGRPRWIHCTPLLGATGAVGVWMVILVDDDKNSAGSIRRFRPAPPVADEIQVAKRNGSPINGCLDDLDVAEGDDDVFDMRSKRHSLPLLRSSATAAQRRPTSAMSEQRGLRAASSSARTSIRSFALS
jgi:hypothetical protein